MNRLSPCILGNTVARRIDMISDLCRWIQETEASPTLEQMAHRCQLSPSYFHRLFKQITGVTPAAYIQGLRRTRVRQALHEAATVTEAVYAAGFQSNSRFYEQADSLLGMTPTDFRNGGSQNEVWFAVGQCSLGAILVAQSRRGVCSISLGDDPQALVHELEDYFPQAQLRGNDVEFERLVALVVGLVENPHLELNLPLDIRGTAFQQRVWQALRQIPAGTKLTYSELAQRIGHPRAVRAVASACGANRLAVAIPCHRVVRQNGDPSGYRWGIERKNILLQKEEPSQR
jgi:AraC family transcriptional regulator, regulatory protein of adaptative response / methylated-DNA-[protein]-cysteine methyltransferase